MSEISSSSASYKWFIKDCSQMRGVLRSQTSVGGHSW